jgi:hypothetical protein
MSSKLRRFLAESYLGEKEFITSNVRKDYAIQIDDLDDNDDLTQFCTMFVTVGNAGNFVFELLGPIPLTQEIVDLAEIYSGTVERAPARLLMRLNINQIEMLMDLAKKIRATSRMGYTIENPNWHRISARTISSMYRFVRVVKEYTKIKGQIA